MKPKIFSFIRPILTLLDSGKFFRKPFAWLYAAIGIFSLLAPFLLIINTVWWNHANQNKMETQKMYQEVLMPPFQKLKIKHDTLTQAVEKYGKEMNNAIDCLTKATKQADYYGEYASYGPEYKQIYINALDVKKQWDLAFKDATKRWDIVNAELDRYKPKYEIVKLRVEKAKLAYEAARKEFERINRIGTFFKSDDLKDRKTVMGLILFSVMLILVGGLNFLLWWSRLLDLKTLIKVQDSVVAIPIAAHFIRTFGETMGLTVCIWGFFTGMIQLTCNMSIGQFGLNFEELGVWSLFLSIVVGFLMTFLSRIFSELFQAVVISANHSGE